MIKLKYKTIEFNGLTIYYAKYRRNRNIRLSIDMSGTIKLTCPYYISEEELLSFIEEKESWIRKYLNKSYNTTNLSSMPPLNKAQKQELLLRIKRFVEKYELLMNTHVNNISLRKMKTLWGSCSIRDASIRFNSYLYYMSDYFLEYIVVHEMTHLFIPNHSKRFYEMVKKYLPDYKNRWKEHKNVSIR
jgi:hypothetical protein